MSTHSKKRGPAVRRISILSSPSADCCCERRYRETIAFAAALELNAFARRFSSASTGSGAGGATIALCPSLDLALTGSAEFLIVGALTGAARGWRASHANIIAALMQK